MSVASKQRSVGRRWHSESVHWRLLQSGHSYNRDALKLEIKVIQTSGKLYFDRSRSMTSKRSEKIRLTIKRFWLCSRPASESIFSNLIFFFVVDLNDRGSVAVGRPVLFWAVIMVLVVKVAWLGNATPASQSEPYLWVTKVQRLFIKSKSKYNNWYSDCYSSYRYWNI